MEHIFGTGFLVNKKMKNLIIDFHADSMRLCSIRIKGKFFNISIICAHAPTEDKSEDEKDDFYDALERIYGRCPRNDIKTVIGDLNVKIGKEDQLLPCIGEHSLHEITNMNGHRLINFAASKNMQIASTKFEHKEIYKVTRISPDGCTLNQIDGFVIDTRHK
jgi:exonuclease III